MNQRADFVNNLQANPTDVVARKVFADWLDEHNEPELAAWMRDRKDSDPYEPIESWFRVSLPRRATQGVYPQHGFVQVRAFFSNGSELWNCMVQMPASELGIEHPILFRGNLFVIVEDMTGRTIDSFEYDPRG